MKDINKLKQNHSQFLSMTSLTVEEFELLHDKFEGYCEDYFLYHTIRGKIRKKICYQEQKNASIKGSEIVIFAFISEELSLTAISRLLFWDYTRQSKSIDKGFCAQYWKRPWQAWDLCHRAILKSSVSN